MIRVINWSSFQSYKDRKPPWVRLHKTLLDNYEFQTMSANARAFMPMLWLLASEHSDPRSGLIECEFDKIAFRLRLTIKDVNSALQEICAAGFIELNQSCTQSVTKALRNRTQTVPPETETETETEKEEAGVVTLKRSRPTSKKMTDSEWMDSLKKTEAYNHINLDAEYSKMAIWCQAHSKQPTRARFLNWINRIDKPMKGIKVQSIGPKTFEAQKVDNTKSAMVGAFERISNAETGLAGVHKIDGGNVISITG